MRRWLGLQFWELVFGTPLTIPYCNAGNNWDSWKWWESNTKIHFTEELSIFIIWVVLVSRNNTIFYGESAPKIFASFAVDKYIHTFSVRVKSVFESYIETRINFYKFSGLKWLTIWVGYWTPNQSHSFSYASFFWTPPPPAPLPLTHHWQLVYVLV